MSEHDAVDARLRAIPDEAGGEPIALEALLAVRAAGAQGHPLDGAVVADPAARAALAQLAEPVPEAMARRAAAAVPQGRARRMPWVVGGLALAAALAVFILRPASLPDPYRVASLRGGEQVVRSEVRESTRFLPHNRLRLVVVPAGEALSGPPPAVRVLVSADGGALTLGEDVRVVPKDGAFRIEAEAGTLFGVSPGPKVLFVGFAHKARTLDGAVGASPEAARALGGVRWIEVPVTYALTRLE